MTAWRDADHVLSRVLRTPMAVLATQCSVTNSPPNAAVDIRRYFIVFHSQSFCGLGVWVQLSWVALAQVLL